MKTIDLPNLRQTYGYDCGATALQSILVYYGIEIRADQIIKFAGTSEDGHYVVAIGYTRDKIFFEDPSSFKRTYLKYNELEKRWHDVDQEGRRYFNHGIAIFGKSPQFKRNEVVHMG